MRKTLALFAALLLAATLSLAVAGCPERAMAPKEETKSDAKTTPAPLTEPTQAAPATK